MATEITSIDELNSTDIKEQQDILTTFLAEKYPTIDLYHGVMHDIVLYVNAIFSSKERTELERWKSARSLLAIIENPDIADNDSVDNILSNYNVVRKEGTYATGIVSLEFLEDFSVIIPANITFKYRDLTYVTEDSYIVDSSTSGSTVADRVLTKLDNGRYGCTIPVVATITGTSSCIKRGTELTTTEITSLYGAFAYEDFYGGSDAETNEELILRLKSGIATKCWGNRENIKSLLRNDAMLNSLVDVSIVGMHDPEMTRDQITLFPVSVGGKTDIYVKTVPYTTTNTTKLYATLVRKDVEYDYWSVVVPANTLYGMWRVTNVEYPATSLTSSTTTLIQQNSVSTEPSISDSDSDFSMYHNIYVEFSTISDLELHVGDTRQFKVTVMGIPNIDYVQKVCTDRNIVPVNSDVLVKSVVPCIVTADVHITQHKNNTVADTTVNDIKSTVAKVINNKGFSGLLAASELTDNILELLTTGQVITSVQLNGIILGPNGVMYRDVSNKQIKIPDMPLNYITKNTTSFFSDITYIDVELTTIDE